MKYLQPNIKDIDAANIIKKHIDNSTPFAFTRFGDGEIHILNRTFNSIKFKKRFTSNWGFKFPEEYEKALDMFYPILKESIVDSDMIGLMDKENTVSFIKGVGYSEEKWSINHDTIIKMGLNPDHVKVADHQLPRKQILGDINEFKKVLGDNPLHIISPYKHQLENNKISEILGVDVSYSQVPFQMSLNDRAVLLKALDTIKDSVVVFGCGAGGKDIGVKLKKHGKIALDLGATIGAWAGVIERGWFKEGASQHHCLIKRKDL